MAIPTADEFKKRHPRFVNAGSVLIQRALDAAQLIVDPAAFGIRYELAVEYKAAADLESGKYGQIEPANKGVSTEYQKKFEELCRLVPRRGMVL